MKVHACFLDRECRDAGGGIIWRVSLNTKKRWYGVALRPEDRFVTRKKDAPPYVRGEHYLHGNYYPTWFRVEKK